MEFETNVPKSFNNLDYLNHIKERSDPSYPGPQLLLDSEIFPQRTQTMDLDTISFQEGEIITEESDLETQTDHFDLKTFLKQLQNTRNDLSEIRLRKVEDIKEISNNLNDFFKRYIHLSEEKDFQNINFQKNFLNTLNQLIIDHNQIIDVESNQLELSVTEQNDQLKIDFNNLISNFSTMTDELNNLSIREQEMMDNFQKILLGQFSLMSTKPSELQLELETSELWLKEQQLELQTNIENWQKLAHDELEEQKNQLRTKQELIQELENRNKDLEKDLKIKFNEYESKSNELKKAHILLNERENKLREIWDDVKNKLEILDTKTEELEIKSKELEGKNNILIESKIDLETQTAELLLNKNLLLDENKKLEEDLKLQEDELQKNNYEFQQTKKTSNILNNNSEEKRLDFIHKLDDEWNTLNNEKDRLYEQKKKLSEDFEEEKKNLDNGWNKLIEDRKQFEKFSEEKTKLLYNQQKGLKDDIKDLNEKRIRLETDNRITENELELKRKEMDKIQIKVIELKKDLNNGVLDLNEAQQKENLDRQQLESELRAELESKLKPELIEQLEKSLRKELKEEFVANIQEEFESERMDLEADRVKLNEKVKLFEKQQDEHSKLKKILEKKQSEVEKKQKEITNSEEEFNKKSDDLNEKEKQLSKLENELKAQIGDLNSKINELGELEEQLKDERQVFEVEKEEIKERTRKLDKQDMKHSKQKHKQKQLDKINKTETTIELDKPVYKEELEIIINKTDESEEKNTKRNKKQN